MNNRKVRKYNRRQFAQTLAALAATPLAVDGVAEQAQAQADPPKVVIDALGQIARSRYGKFLTAEQLDNVKRNIARNQFTAEFLKKVKLQNSDEPAFAFRAELP